VSVITLVANLVMTIKFLKNTHRIVEVSRLPKLMTILANLAGILISFTWWYMYIYPGISDIILVIIFDVFGFISAIVNYVYWIRFSRVQFQLKASKETTKEIMRAIDHSKRFSLEALMISSARTSLMLL